jgi:hypothetical protein
MVLGVTQGPTEQGNGTPFFTTQDLADRWLMSTSAVHTFLHRHRDDGVPRPIKIGKKNLYRATDVVAFETTREQQ